MYSPMQTIPSSFDICCFVFAKMNKRILLINKIPQSIIDSFSTCSGERMAENPRINKMLNQNERFLRHQRREKRLKEWGYSSTEFDMIMEKHLRSKSGIKQPGFRERLRDHFRRR